MGKKNSDDGLTWLNNRKILHFSLDFLLSLILSYVTVQNCKIHNPPSPSCPKNPQNQILSWHFLHIKILSKWPSENTREVSKALQFQAMKLKIKIAWRINASQTYKGFWETIWPVLHMYSMQFQRFILTGTIIHIWIFIHIISSSIKYSQVVIEYFFRKQKSNQKLVMRL